MAKNYEIPDNEPQMVSEQGVAFTANSSSNMFSPYQLKVINLMGHVNDDKEMSEISDLLSNYFAQKAISEADALWEEGKINEATISEWKHEHMRTQY